MAKWYFVKECLLTLQGEGGRAGAKSVFLRLGGCNAWTGRAEDRSKGKGACARWCDTDFFGGEKMSAVAIRLKLDELWAHTPLEQRWVVISGGEPALQLDSDLLYSLRANNEMGAGWLVAVETNGSLDPVEADPEKDGEGGFNVLDNVDWLTVSPKIGLAPLRMRGVELKVVLPGAVGGEEGWTEEHLVAMEESGDFHYLYVQPQDPVDPSAVEQSHLKGGSWGGVEELGRARNTTAASAQYQNNVQQCIDFCMRHPRWRVSIQTHKFMNLR